MSREVWELKEPVDPEEVYETLQMVDIRGGNCDYFQNICIEYLLGMINDLRERVDELEQRNRVQK